MTKHFILAAILLFLPHKSFATDETFHVEVDPKVYDPSAFKGKGVKTGKIPPRQKRPDALPDKKDREAAFEKVPGLEQDIAKMDELERDVFFVRAKTKPLKELQNLYPKVDASKLAQLQKVLQKP